ncbi:F0F1 ATP synthase subunit epsilon [Desulfovibrio sp. OttesenSCG-928-C06]|nr:F0F1 ATP synthase subunit epsilon [Desulfovibrio sp. OttesenSCG-928-C06]
MASSIQLDIVTPDKAVLSAQVEYVGAPGIEGEFGVLPGHAAMLSALGIGCVNYTENGRKNCAFVSGGFAEINSDKMTILAESAELSVNIDEARAREALKRAEERLKSNAAEVDVDRANAALHRAIARLQVHSSHSALSK